MFDLRAKISFNLSECRHRLKEVGSRDMTRTRTREILFFALKLNTTKESVLEDTSMEIDEFWFVFEVACPN